MLRQRNTAHKLWISQIFSGKYISTEDHSYLDLNEQQITKVNIIGNITFVNSSESYASALLDDGSGVIRLKAWQQSTQLLSSLNLGDITIVIGKVREYNGERYIAPDTVKVLDDPNWLLVRQLELLREQPISHKGDAEKPALFHEERIEDSPLFRLTPVLRNKILEFIDAKSISDGSGIDDIATGLSIGKKEAEAAVFELIKEGEVYEYKPGRLKLLQ